MPKGVYNVVNGFGPNSAGEFLTAHPGVNGITFTGETRTGTAIMKAAPTACARCRWNWAARTPASSLPTATSTTRSPASTRSCFENCGQVCLGTERVYVERPIFDKFVAALKAKAERPEAGRPDDQDTKIGPLISKEHQNKVLSYYARPRTRAPHRHRRRRARHARRTQGRLLGAADHLDRPARDRHRGARGIFGPLLPHPALRHRGRGAGHGQRQPLRPGHLDLDQDISARHRLASRSRSACAGSTAGSCATCAPPSAAPSSRASAAKAACTRWSSTPNCAT
jgi:aminomuconate-semialdehyde/2-hydroxymuconate-6-semialdehyde dehydrogenase